MINLPKKKNYRLVVQSRTGLTHIVYQNDFSNKVFKCYKNVTLLGTKHVRVESDIKFRHDEVTSIETCELTPEQCENLYRQYLNLPENIEAVRKYQKADLIDLKTDSRSLVKPHDHGPLSDRLFCPYHHCHMRYVYRSDTNGKFYGCPMHTNHGCRITVSADGKKLNDPDRVLSQGYWNSTNFTYVERYGMAAE